MIRETTDEIFFKSLIGSARRAPLQGQWEITCRCNLRCVMCYTDCFNTPERVRAELSTAEILRIMDELKEAGVFALTLTGGEPLARPDFKDIYAYAVGRGFLVTVYTNGTLITESVADLWAERSPDGVEISLHGLGKDFDAITAVRGSFEKCLRGIRLLLDRKIPVTLKTVGMTLNKDRVMEIKKYAESLGNAGWRFGEWMRPALDGSTRPLDLQLGEEELLTIEREDERMLAEHLKQKKEREEKAASPLENRCGSARRFHIDAYGGLQLCSKRRKETYDLRKGNFKEGFYEVLPSFHCPRKPTAAARFMG